MLYYSWHLLVVELETHTQDRVRRFIIALSYIEQCLAKVSTEIKVDLDIEVAGILVSAHVKSLTEFPTGSPCLLMSIGNATFTSSTLAVDRTQLGHTVT